MIRLIYNYYEDKNPIRKKEIDFCLQKNLDNKFINTIIFESASKPSYDFLFNKINTLTSPDDINIICNSDIFFDETISLVANMPHKNVYALSRWDWNTNNASHFARNDSQDTWIIKGKIENVVGNFTLGIPGCDNRIAHEFNRAGYRVTNPSNSIKTYHVHNSHIRNYSYNNPVPGPYMRVDVSSL